MKPGAIIIEGHVQGLALTRSLGENDIPVIVVDKNNCIARYSKYCKKFFKCPDFYRDEFIDFLIRLSNEENLFGWSLFPSNDHAVYNISKNKELLKDFKIITPDFDVISRIYNKYFFLKIAESLSIPVPRTYSYIEYLNNSYNLVYPLLIKGREGLTFFKNTGKKVFYIENELDLNKKIKEISKKIEEDKIILQECISYYSSRDVWSYTAFCIEGTVKSFWIGRKVREHPQRFGTATLSVSDYDETVCEYSSRLLRKLKYTGVCEIEYIKEIGGEFKIIEMNARTWLWIWLAKYCEIDYALMIYNYLNELPYHYPADYRKGIRWMNFWTDLYFSVKAIISNKLTLKDYLNETKNDIVQAVYNKNDNMPFIMMTLLLPYLIYKRS